MAETGQVLHQKRTRVARASRAGLVAALLVGPGEASAAETRPIADAIVLGAQRCLQREALSRRLGTWLGREVVDVRIAIAIDEDPGAVRFVLRRDGAVVGERTIAVGDDSCDDVTAAVALAIASAIEVAARDDEGTAAAPLPPGGSDPAGPQADPADFVPEAPPAPDSAAPPAAPPAPAATAPPASASTPAEASTDDAVSPRPDEAEPGPRTGTVALTVEAAALLGVFPLPAFAVAPGASLGLTEHAEVRLSAIGSVPVITDLDPEGTAEVGLFAGRLDLCGGDHLLGGHAWIRGCGGVAVGGMAAEGVEVEAPSAAVGAWIAVAGRAELQWTPGSSPVGIAFSLDGFVPAVRPRLQVRGTQGDAAATRDLPILGVSAAAGPCLAF